MFGDSIVWNSIIVKKKPEKPVVVRNSESHTRRHLAVSSLDVASLKKRQEGSVTAWNSESHTRRHLAASSFNVASLKKRQEGSVVARNSWRHNWRLLAITGYNSSVAIELRKFGSLNRLFRPIVIKMHKNRIICGKISALRPSPPASSVQNKEVNSHISLRCLVKVNICTYSEQWKMRSLKHDHEILKEKVLAIKIAWI